MFRGRSLQSVCLPCRFNVLVSHTRTLRPRATAQLLRASTYPRTSTALSQSLQQQQQTFATTARRRQEAHEPDSSSKKPDDVPLTPNDRLTNEVDARKARQTFGDYLPREHLSEEAYAVYERLYGPPIFLEPGEELPEAQAEGEEIIAEERPDGSTVLLRRGEDGELEEVEIFDEANEEIGDEEDEESYLSEKQWEEIAEEKSKSYHDSIYEKTRIGLQDDIEAEETDEIDDEGSQRAHPLTIAGRSKPFPSTVFLPKESLVDPTALLLTRANHKHLAESSNQIFGGMGLPFSASTVPASMGKKQTPIPLDPSQSDMGNIQADAYMASVQPGTYASVMSTLVEVRKRLGSPWIEHLLKMKKGGMVLDAGSGGVGILAWHEVLKAEWERINENSDTKSKDAAPLGRATVLAGSDTLRHRASRLLENTTFIPRLPEDVPLEEERNPHQPRKQYDLIIAPHTLWPIKQEYLRKEQVEKYWSLLNPKGGVLILIEKGLPRGFEVVAAARDLLLQKHIASPGAEDIETPMDQQVGKPDEDTRFTKKETGMIVAPCTNHAPCPMYLSPGISLGRKDFCYFSQRYIRPPYLQRILDATDRNHEDVQFSYVAVQRGRDQRLPEHDLVGKGVQQSEQSTLAALEGYEWNPETEENHTSSEINTLTLPRMILPALKRRGHVTLELCTPAGTIERWTVPRSFSRQAYRDARKARWGDLWALGAKTRMARPVRLGRPRDEFDKKGRRIKAPKKMVVEVDVSEHGLGDERVKSDGRYGIDRKIRGSGGRKGRKKQMDLRGEFDLGT